MATNFPTFTLSTAATLPACPPLLSLFTGGFDDCSCAINVMTMNVPFIMFATLAFGTLVYLFELYLDFRQRAQYNDNTPPAKLFKVVEGITDGKALRAKLEDKFLSSQSYGADKAGLSIASSTYEMATSSLQVVRGTMPWMWSLAVSIGAEQWGWGLADEIKLSAIFFVIMTLVGEAASLPVSLYSTFVVEKSHGFNKTTPLLYLTDKLKTLALTFAIGIPFTSLLLYIIDKTGEFFYLYAWALMVAFTLFMLTLYPVFIMPLFNKYEPLPEGALKESIFALAGRIDYPLTKLFVVDGSKRSSHSNAYMFGFGKNKRIVLFDTLMTQVSDDEILSILGHELGHWKLNHTLINFCITQAYFGAAFFFFGQCFASVYLYEAFGFDGAATPTLIKLLLFFSTVWTPVDKVLSFLLTINSRFAEFAADKFSIGLGMKSLQSGLTKISLENLGSMKPDWAYATYHYSHPPLVERLAAMEVEQNNYNAKKK